MFLVPEAMTVLGVTVSPDGVQSKGSSQRKSSPHVHLFLQHFGHDWIFVSGSNVKHIFFITLYRLENQNYLFIGKGVCFPLCYLPFDVHVPTSDILLLELSSIILRPFLRDILQ